ncbi:MAG: hypothetical protein ACI88G_000458 [Woeseiaceae bacterium]|jgi:hypothetical protein
MSCFRNTCITLIGSTIIISSLILGASEAHGAGFVLGAGADADSADGRALSAFGDFSIADKTWLSATFRKNEIDGVSGRRSTTFADVGIDHWFDPLGVRLSASYWGDKDILHSADLGASLYYRDESFMFSANYERREFDFTVLSDFPALSRTVEFSADGIGISSRFPLGENSSFHVGGIAYDYSRDIRLQPDIDALRFLSFSRMSMMNSLIDHQVNAGVEFRFGLRALDFTAGSWQTAVDGGRVDSYSVGFLTPVSERTDLEFRFSFDDSENFGQTTAVSVYLYYFGGT